MKIAVTGALGHIGSRLVRYLPDAFPGIEVVMIDNLMTQRFVSLFDLPNTGTYRFVEADVTTTDLTPIIAGADALVHLAAITDATRSLDNPDEFEKVNLTATKLVADACARTGVPMIHASSTSVYGTHRGQVDEDCHPEELAPQSPYATTKLLEEEYVELQTQTAGLRAITFRFGTIFGTSPGMRFHTAVNKFCWQAVMGTPLTVWRTAYEQKRPYLDLTDACRAISFFVESDLFDGRAYNVVTRNATVSDVVASIRTHIPKTAVEFVDHKIMNQLSYDVKNSHLEPTGFQFVGSMDKCIEDTIYMLLGAQSAS